MYSGYKIWSKFFNWLVILIGAGVLIGWEYDIGVLKRPFPLSFSMNPSTAVASILSGVAFLLITSNNNKFRQHTIGLWVALIVFLIGFCKIGSVILGFDIQFDHFLFQVKFDPAIPGDHISRMGANTAFCYMCSAVALLLMKVKTTKRITYSNIVVFILWSISLLSVLGYTYHVGPLTGALRYISMAFYAALCFLFQSLAIFLAYPEKGIMKEFSSPFEGGSIARRFAFPAIAFPIALGFFRIYITDKGIIPSEMESEVVILCIVIVFVIFIYKNAVSLNKKDMERKVTEEKLLENQQLIISFMNNTSSLIYVKDLEGKFLLVNDTYERVFGINKKDMVGKTEYDLLSYESALQVQKNEEDLIRENKRFEGELKLTLGGELNHFISVRFPILNKEGKVYATGGINTNITQIKKQGEVIKDLYDNAPSGYYSLDPQGRFINANNTVLQWLGYTKEEIMGKPLTDYLTKDAKEFFVKLFPLFKQKGYVRDVESVFLRKDGSEIFVLLNSSAVKDTQGNFLHSRSTIVDITKRKKLETALEESNEKFLRLFYSSPLAMVIRDLENGKILDINDEYERLLGYKKSEIVGRTSAEVGMMIDPEFGKQIRSMATQEKSLKNVEAKLYNSKKEPIDVVISIETIRLEDKDCILSALMDITERKKIEEELQIVNKELESFTYSVSHDLRAPLRIINGYAQMIKEEGSVILADEPKRMLNNIVKNAEQMGNLIDDLLNFSRLGRRELVTHVTDMNEVVRPILEHQLNGNSSTPVKLNDLLSCYCDSSLIKQVWENLISNAIKYSAKSPDPSIEIGSAMEKNGVVYYIKDNGAGFDMKYYDKLFGVFQRLHKASEFTGTGVGLALAQRIVLKHGGKIWAESKVNEGTTFYFTVCKL